MKLPSRPIVAAYRSLPVPEGVQAITQLRGNLNARMLLLAEHPTPEDYNNNVPFSGSVASTYGAILQEAGFNIDDHFLVMPFSRFGEKANKASTQDTFPLLRDYLHTTKVQLVAVVGMSAFGFTFAGGRKTHARSIIGNPMFLPQIGTRAVFVLPDSSQLADLGSEDFKTMKRAEDKAQTILNLTLNLRRFAESKYGIQL